MTEAIFHDSADELTKEEFCIRFKAYMLSVVGEKDANGDSVAEYADETAPTYWDDPEQRKWGPEGCAQADLDEWESAAEEGEQA